MFFFFSVNQSEIPSDLNRVIERHVFEMSSDQQSCVRNVIYRKIFKKPLFWYF